jgi:hypothetical protein
VGAIAGCMVVPGETTGADAGVGGVAGAELSGAPTDISHR